MKKAASPLSKSGRRSRFIQGILIEAGAASDFKNTIFM
jgi:hypothetical protein